VSVPYSPALLATPVINPAIGGFNRAFPYVSPSQYVFAPTAMDLENLVTESGASAADQTQALSDLIRRASSEVDRYLFGASPSAKQPSLCATNDVESWRFPVIQGELRVVCDYGPLIALTGMDVGLFQNELQSIGPNIAALVSALRRTFIVPVCGLPLYSPQGLNVGGIARTGQRLYVVWSYDNGYPHTMLAEAAAAADESLVVEATSAAGGLIGVFPGTQLDVLDYTMSVASGVETVTVASVEANTPATGQATVALVAPLQYAHTPPEAPDFIPVSAIPWAVQQAVIHVVTALVKGRGDDALLLEGVGEARTGETDPGEKTVDIVRAFKALQSYRTAVKIKT